MFDLYKFVREEGTEEDYKQGKKLGLNGAHWSSITNFGLRSKRYMEGYGEGYCHVNRIRAHNKSLIDGAIEHERNLTFGIPESDL